jgi:hypothetical protein
VFLPSVETVNIKMKIVIWKSPKYLSKILSKLFGVEEEKEKK